MGHATFNVEDLEAVIGDNAGHENHRSGYNGVWSLKHKTSTRSIFVPAYAGLNLEHVFNGETEWTSKKAFFEPRNAPMSFKQIDEATAELHQPQTPETHVESTTRYTLKAPHYIDIDFRCTPHQHAHPRGWFGLFWASYINGPLDKSFYFKGGWAKDESIWMQHCTQKHNAHATVAHHGDDAKLTFKEGDHDALFMNLSPMRYAEPFYYGYFEDLVYVIMFDRAEGIRFTHSPSGGGRNKALNTSNPAWDHQLIVPKYEVMKSYGFKARVVLRPRCSREEVVKEVAGWKA